MIARLRPTLLRVQSFISSIRFRLALWFTLVLALALVLFGAFVYLREAQAVQVQAAARVSYRLHSVGDFLRRASNEAGENGHFFQPGGTQANPFLLQQGEVLVLADTNHQVIGSWGDANPSELQQITQQATADPNSGPFEFILTSLQPHLYLFQPLPVVYEGQTLGWIILGQPVDPDGQLARLLLTLGIGVGVMVLAAMVGGYWLADRALAPVKTITHTARSISDSDLGQRINLHSRDELGQLAGTFDLMLDRLQAAFQRQRQFTADASHELRTPLTIVGLEVDRVLEAKRGSEADYRRTLEVVRSENEFMTRLVSELLTLARMDAGQDHLKREVVDLSDVALEVVERHASIAASKGVQLETGDLPETPVQGDRQYLLQMTGNLVENAIKYTPGGAGQWVKVETGLSPAGKPWLRVSDRGPGIEPEHLPHLFDRFYRVDQARSHNPGEDDSGDEGEIPGSGLGLSIVQRIVQLHGAEIRVQSEPGHGTVFEVTF